MAAEDVLALLTLSTLLDVLADPMTDLQLGQPLPLEPQGELEPLDHVNCFEHFDPLLEGDLRGVSGGVRERADLTNGAHESGDASVVAAQLQNFLDDRAVLALELACLHARRFLVRTLLHFDSEAALDVGVGRAGDAAVQTDEIDGPDAAGQADPFGDFGHRADLGVLAVVSRHQQDAVLFAHVGRDRDVHVREDDRVVKRDKQQSAQSFITLLLVDTSKIVASTTEATERKSSERARLPAALPYDRPGVAYDEELAERIRELVAGEADLTEKKMFGGLAFLIGGNMAVAASGQGGALVRVDPAQSDTLVATTNARLMEMRGRSMQGWLRVDSGDLRTKRQLAKWVDLGTTYARSLPAKR